MAKHKWGEILGFTRSEPKGTRSAKDLARTAGIILFAVGIASLPWGNLAAALIVALLGVATFAVTFLGKPSS